VFKPRACALHRFSLFFFLVIPSDYIMSTFDMYVDGAVASVCATLVSNPFDVMRTRMQLQGELCKRGTYRVEYRNMGQGMMVVARQEGFLALQKGLASAVLWQITQNGIRIGLYPAMRAEVSHIFHSDALYVSILAGALCGLVGNYASSPFQMVKTRLQGQQTTALRTMGAKEGGASSGPSAAASAPTQYAGVRDAFRKIYKQGGLRGLWSGANIAAQRTVVFSATQLTSYEVAKTRTCALTGWAASDIRVHICAAVFSATCIVVFVNPLDVVMTRCFNQRRVGPKVYSSNLAIAIGQVYRVEGIHGLYKGSLAVFSRYAPHNIVTFVTLEFLRKLREKYTNRSYTSESNIDNSIGFRKLKN
jgi:solute carrier family 25, member 34/35